MNRILVASVLAVLACRPESSSSLPDGAPPGARIVGNCVMNPALCPDGTCLSQGGEIYCVCSNLPPGQACEPCPRGYRYHGKSYSCVPTCEVVAPTCKAGETCQEDLGTSSCRPAPADSAAAD